VDKGCCLRGPVAVPKNKGHGKIVARNAPTGTLPVFLPFLIIRRNSFFECVCPELPDTIFFERSF
jgi:hypothetical protein